MATIDQLEEQRRLALERLDQLRQFYDRPEAANLMSQFQSRAGGTDAPFTPGVTNSLLAANADASAGQAAGDLSAIRQQFANAGLGGSGLETSAILSSRRRAGAAARSGRREITSRAALENFQARERAQQQIAAYLRDRQQAEQAAGLAEVDFRSQMREVTDAPPGAPGAPGAPTGTAPRAGAVPLVRPPSGFGMGRALSVKLPSMNTLYAVNPSGNGFGAYGNPLSGAREAAPQPFVPTWSAPSYAPRQAAPPYVGPPDNPNAWQSSGSWAYTRQ